MSESVKASDVASTTVNISNSTTPAAAVVGETTGGATQITESFTTGYIPEPPPLPIEALDLTSLGEASLRSLGLGSYFTPVGWMQLALESLHIHLDLSWFSSIILFTVLLRILILPITIKIQRNAVKMRILTPQMTVLQEKISEAKAKNNHAES